MPQPFYEAAAETLANISNTVARVQGHGPADQLAHFEEDVVNGVIRQLLYLAQLPDAPAEYREVAAELDDNGEVGPITRKTITRLDLLVLDHATRK